MTKNQLTLVIHKPPITKVAIDPVWEEVEIRELIYTEKPVGEARKMVTGRDGDKYRASQKKRGLVKLGVLGPLKPCCAFPYYLAHLYRIQGYV